MKNLVKSFDKVVPINGVTLEVEKGKFVTLLGPSGCGKTTTLRCIAGLEVPTSGEIYFDDQIMNNISVHKRGVGFVFQNWALFPHLTVEKNISFGLEMSHTPKNEIKKRVKESLDLVRLPGFEKRLPNQLSGGQQQRVAVARAIVTRPRVLLFDEPLSNLDAKLRKEMRAELKNLHKDLGITTLYVTHDQEEALTLSDKIILLYKAKIQQMGNPIQIFNHPTNHFVADFMGFENFFKAKTLSQIKNKEMEVESEIGRLTIKDILIFKKFSKGGEIEVTIRPDHIKINNEGECKTNVVKGYVEVALYQGDKTRYFVKFQKRQVQLSINHEGPPLKKKGDEISLYLDPKYLVPIKLKDGEK